MIAPEGSAKVCRLRAWEAQQQPENCRQVWLFATVSGVSVGAVQATVSHYLLHGHWSPIASLPSAIVYTFVFGLGRLVRLRKRQDARWRD